MLRGSLALAPDAPRVLVNLGTALRSRADRRGGRPIRAALALRPRRCRGHFNLANARLPGLRRARRGRLRPRRGAAPDYAERITISPAC